MDLEVGGAVLGPLQGAFYSLIHRNRLVTTYRLRYDTSESDEFETGPSGCFKISASQLGIIVAGEIRIRRTLQTIHDVTWRDGPYALVWELERKSRTVGGGPGRN